MSVRESVIERQKWVDLWDLPASQPSLFGKASGRLRIKKKKECLFLEEL